MIEKRFHENEYYPLNHCSNLVIYNSYMILTRGSKGLKYCMRAGYSKECTSERLAKLKCWAVKCRLEANSGINQFY